MLALDTALTHGNAVSSRTLAQWIITPQGPGWGIGLVNLSRASEIISGLSPRLNSSGPLTSE